MTRQSGHSVAAEIAWQAVVGTGLIAIVLGIGYLALSGVRVPSPYGWLVAGYALVAFVIGVGSLRKVRARLYGRSIEERAVHAATKVLPKWGVQIVELGLPVPGLGDIDIVVARGDRRAPVEIKSFQTLKDPDRATHVLYQVRRQMAYLHAEHGIVWLPEAQVGWWRRWRGLAAGPDITVAFGSARNLARIARRWL